VYNDKPHGRGILALNNEVYFGCFRRGRYEGSGLYIYSDGGYYIGSWKSGEFSGLGKFSKIDGYKYRGQWEQNKESGEGKATFANGDRFKGRFKAGKKDEGTLYYQNGGKYTGKFAAGLRTGQATFTDEHRTKYVGVFDATGELTGTVKVTAKNGETTVKQYKSGQEL
jgi:hypothetical protein